MAPYARDSIPQINDLTHPKDGNTPHDRCVLCRRELAVCAAEIAAILLIALARVGAAKSDGLPLRCHCVIWEDIWMIV